MQNKTRPSPSSRGTGLSARCYFSRELRGRPGLAKQYPFYIQYLELSSGCVPSRQSERGALEIPQNDNTDGKKQEDKPTEREVVSSVIKQGSSSRVDSAKKPLIDGNQSNRSNGCCRKVGGILCCVGTVGTGCAALVPVVLTLAGGLALLYYRPNLIDLVAERKERDDAVFFWQEKTKSIPEDLGQIYNQTNRSQTSEIIPLYTREIQPSGGSKGGHLQISEPELSADEGTDSSWWPSWDWFSENTNHEFTTKKEEWIEDFKTGFCKEIKDGAESWTKNDGLACQAIAHSLAYDYTQEIQEYQTLGIYFNLLYSGNLPSYTSLGGSFLIEETNWVAISRLHGMPVPKHIVEKVNTEEAFTYIREADPMAFYHGILTSIGRDSGADLRPLDYTNYALLDTQLGQSEILALPRGSNKKSTIRPITKSSTKSSRKNDKQPLVPNGSNRMKPYKPAVRQPSPPAKNTIISNIEENTHEGRIWHNFSQFITSEMTLSGQTRNPETFKFENSIDAKKIREFWPHFRRGFLMMNGQDVGKQDRVDLQAFIRNIIGPMKKVILQWVHSDAEMMGRDGKIQKSARQKLEKGSRIRNAFLVGSGLVLITTSSPALLVGAAVSLGYSFYTDQQNKDEVKKFVDETATILEEEKVKKRDEVLSQTSTEQHQKFQSASIITLPEDKENTPILELESVPLWTNIPWDPQCQMYIEEYLETHKEIPQVQTLDESGQFFCQEYLMDGAEQFSLNWGTAPGDSPAFRTLRESATTGRYGFDRPAPGFHHKSDSPNVSQKVLHQVSPSYSLNSSKKTHLHEDTSSSAEKQPSLYNSKMRPDSFKMKRVYFEKPDLFLQEVLMLEKEDLQERKNLFAKLMARFESVSNFKKTRPELLYALRGPTNIFIKLEAQKPQFGKPWLIRTKNQDSTTPIIEFPETTDILEHIIRYDLYVGRVNLINCIFHPIYYTYFKKLTQLI